MRPIPIIVLAVLTTTAAFAGCIAVPGADSSATQGFSSNEASHEMRIADAFTDADKRAYNSVGGQDSTEMTINVPFGTERLLVKAAYVVGGQAGFQLENPLRMPEKQDFVQGAKDVWDEEWYAVENPLPGPWRFTTFLQGGGEYAFGFYY